MLSFSDAESKTPWTVVKRRRLNDRLEGPRCSRNNIPLHSGSHDGERFMAYCGRCRQCVLLFHPSGIDIVAVKELSDETPVPPFLLIYLFRMAMTCEALAYADISGVLVFSKNRIFADKLGYVLLDVTGRSILEMLAFSTVTAIWLKTAIESSPSVLWGSHQSTPFGILPPLFLLLILLLVLVSATLSAIALVVYQDDALETIQELPWSRAQTMLEAIAWGVHALVVIECSFVTSKRVLNLVPTSQWTQRLSLMGKTVLPMLVASLVYATRCLWLLAIFWRCESVARGTWAWWIGFAWLPTWLAVGVLLYSARKRDQLPASEEMMEPLLLPARPPAEAFMAFSRHRQGLGVDDSFSFCRSPITYVVAMDPEGWDVTDEEALSSGGGAAAATS
jgi:hypothetical protein